MIEVHSTIFPRLVNSFWPPFRALVAYHLERGGMPLHDAVGVRSKNVAITHMKVQANSIWAKEWMLDNCGCIIWHDINIIIKRDIIINIIINTINYWLNCTELVWWSCYIGSDIWFQDNPWEASWLDFQSSFSSTCYLEEVLASVPW